MRQFESYRLIWRVCFRLQQNITIENVNFLNSYKGHVMQICACDTVVVDNCNFLGQAIPSTLSDSDTTRLETIQIEPVRQKDSPYALNDDGIAATMLQSKLLFWKKRRLWRTDCRNRNP